MRVFERLLAEEPAWSELLAEVERELQPAKRPAGPSGRPRPSSFALTLSRQIQIVSREQILGID
jgi:hypothetical protein